MTTLLQLPPPQPYTGPDPCPTCHGKGITGAQYRFLEQLLVDEVCPTCSGCGRSHHEACDPRQHAGWEPDESDLDDDEGRQPCASCFGRGWNDVIGFTPNDAITYLRVPCGCAEADMVQVETEDGGGGSDA